MPITDQQLDADIAALMAPNEDARAFLETNNNEARRLADTPDSPMDQLPQPEGMARFVDMLFFAVNHNLAREIEQEIRQRQRPGRSSPTRPSRQL